MRVVERADGEWRVYLQTEGRGGWLIGAGREIFEAFRNALEQAKKNDLTPWAREAWGRLLKGATE